MNTTADRVMDDYSSLDDKEKAEFDRRYKELMKFRKQLKEIVKTVDGKKAAKLETEAIRKLASERRVGRG